RLRRLGQGGRRDRAERAAPAQSRSAQAKSGVAATRPWPSATRSSRSGRAGRRASAVPGRRWSCRSATRRRPRSLRGRLPPPRAPTRRPPAAAPPPAPGPPDPSFALVREERREAIAAITRRGMPAPEPAGPVLARAAEREPVSEPTFGAKPPAAAGAPAADGW